MSDAYQAAADKLVREIEMFGPDFERYTPDEEPPKSEPAPVVAAPAAAVDKAKKGKVAAKATGLQYQFQIMESIGVPRAEIKKFADPLHWLEYFPPIARVSPIIHCTSDISNIFIVDRLYRFWRTYRLAPFLYHDRC